jgi:hypothetical protein
MADFPTSRRFLTDIWRALGGAADATDAVTFHTPGALPSAFAVTDLAAGSVAAMGLAIAELTAVAGATIAPLTVDRRLASFWFGTSLRPIGWTAPPAWDPIAGDYLARDGWIRLHTNAPHHRAAALAVLGVPAEKDAVTAAVGTWQADTLEHAVVERGGCAAAMRDLTAWSGHPQGKAVAGEPIVWHDDGDPAEDRWVPAPARPLAGLRVLDLTRVLAGPVATRCLAGFGADVLRIDPLDWDEPGVLPEVTPGKRTARVDLRTQEGRGVLEGLIASCDVLVHGYRPEALGRLGFDAATRRRLRPGLIDVCLDAYGWSGPWRNRRGFDSLVQMSSGIAAEGMRRFGTDRPRPLPVQALDHATGFIMAAAAIRCLTRRVQTGRGSGTRASLARTAALLTSVQTPDSAGPFSPAADQDHACAIEQTGWGPAHRLRPPVEVDGAAMRWDRPAGPLGTADPVWAVSR